MAEITFDDLAHLPIFKDFYGLATRLFGVSIVLMNPDTPEIFFISPPDRINPFCMSMYRNRSGHSRCSHSDVASQQRVKESKKPLRYQCHAGLREFIIPIIVGGRIVAYLLCGQVLDANPTAADWRQTKTRLKGLDLDWTVVRKQYLKTRVVPAATQENLIELLQLFANYIADAGVQLMWADKFRKSYVGSRANAFISAHATEAIRLGDVARETHTSKRNLIRILKSETGMGVRETINRVRIEKARDLLKDPARKVSVIALDCGYSSVQQFIRVFKRVTNTTPRIWRIQWQGAQASK